LNSEKIENLLQEISAIKEILPEREFVLVLKNNSFPSKLLN